MDDDRLDTLLSLYRAAEPGAALRERIIAAAPRQRAIGRAWRWMRGVGLGAALAACGAAGVAAGFTLAPESLTRVISGRDAAVADGAVADIGSLADPAADPASG